MSETQKYVNFDTMPKSKAALVHNISPDLGMGIFEHDIACHCCFDEKAINGNQPCWKCQDKGYRTVKLSKFWLFVLRTFGVIDKTHWSSYR